MELVLSGDRPERPDYIWRDSDWELIELCWHQDPDIRPTFPEIEDHLKNKLSTEPRKYTYEDGEQGSAPLQELAVVSEEPLQPPPIQLPPESVALFSTRKNITSSRSTLKD